MITIAAVVALLLLCGVALVLVVVAASMGYWQRENGPED